VTPTPTVTPTPRAEAQAIGFQHWAAAILGVLGLIAMAHEEYATARGRCQQSLRLFEVAPDWVELSGVQNYLAGLDAREGNLEAARAGYAASLSITRPRDSSFASRHRSTAWPSLPRREARWRGRCASPAPARHCGSVLAIWRRRMSVWN
jgi:hypothetical protein